jgi:hypothetical protein
MAFANILQQISSSRRAWRERLPGVAEAAWDDLQYEPQRKLLLQCPDRTVLQQSETGMER